MPLQISATTRNRVYQFHPRQMATISEGTPYVVPTGRIFVVTGIGLSELADVSIPALVSLTANGVLELMGGLHGCSMSTTVAGVGFVPDVCTGVSTPPCISFAAGVTLAVTSGGTGSGRVWGYHAPA